MESPCIILCLRPRLALGGHLGFDLVTDTPNDAPFVAFSDPDCTAVQVDSERMGGGTCVDWLEPATVRQQACDFPSRLRHLVLLA